MALGAAAWAADASAPTTSTAAAVTTATSPTTEPQPATLPSNIQWETNLDDPPIGDPAALKGGTYNTFMEDYPLTFRLMGPNANDSFASWNRSYTMDFTLVTRHPNTDRFIPWMATHWSIADDHRTIYYKLRPEARWSDGHPVTAHDYVFTIEMMRSKDIVDPFYNTYVQTYFESAQAIDDHTLKVVGKQPSWRPLVDYALWPTPRHAIKLGPNWIKEANNTPQVTVGPYVISGVETGKRVVFSRIKNWWGEGRDYFKGMYNVDKIVIRVIPEERVLDYFKSGEIDFTLINTARIWHEGMNFPAIRNGWVHKKRVFVEMPQGLYGLAMNLENPLLHNRDFRTAIQYLFNFDAINKNLMYGDYYRMSSAFTGTEYANPNLKPYTFDPRKAKDHLAAAGFKKRGPDGFLVNERGQAARFTVSYPSKGLEPHLIVLQQYYKHFGVDMQLRLMDGGAAFNRLLERKYELAMISFSASFYPEPHQYFSSEFLKTTNNNNFWAFGRPDTDKLINTYRFSMDRQARLDAMWTLDQIIHDEAFYLPFWDAPYFRVLYWDKLCWPKSILPKRTNSPYTDWQVWWIDPAREKRLNEARRAGKPLGKPDPVDDHDPWGVKAALEAKEAAAKSEAKK